VLLVTHEHRDHNVVDAIGGEPAVLRGAGTHESPLGEVVGVASEQDDVAGTRRGANAIVRFELGGLRVAHFGDFGQPALRPEQRAARGSSRCTTARRTASSSTRSTPSSTPSAGP
jgi:hypothetical protein